MSSRGHRDKHRNKRRRRHCEECEGRGKVWDGRHYRPCRFCSGHTQK